MDLFDMDKSDWDDFFDLVDNITNMQGTWKEKYLRVKHEAETRDSLGAVEELAGWFNEGYDD